MPGKNLTRDEARDRADLLSVDSYDVAPRPDHRSDDVPHHHHGDVHAPDRGASTFIDLIADSVEAITLNGESLDPATHFDGVAHRSCPALAAPATS